MRTLTKSAWRMWLVWRMQEVWNWTTLQSSIRTGWPAVCFTHASLQHPSLMQLPMAVSLIGLTTRMWTGAGGPIRGLRHSRNGLGTDDGASTADLVIWPTFSRGLSFATAEASYGSSSIVRCVIVPSDAPSYNTCADAHICKLSRKS